MPFCYTDWKDEVLPICDRSKNPVSTTGWTCEMHVRQKAGISPAIIKLSTSDNPPTLLVGQQTDTGIDNGIAPNVAASSMTMPPGPYVWDVKRTDGGRDEWIEGGSVEFAMPVTKIGLP